MPANNVKRLPMTPQLPAPGTPDFERQLVRALAEMWRNLSIQLDDIERRIKALEDAP